ncbi:hypothetical protein FVE85_5413 [Porphyridium purpureum]|uniref:Uncharacterized protein n=1 Tax=Porphyridium purpureum TaxID=35688 RepID=A0A5J4Z3J7_PORPP|nr:hypothetical protein FVE85_5413 [Porphyridium purpureum]|eukprot:POR5695..scf295_1
MTMTTRRARRCVPWLSALLVALLTVNVVDAQDVEMCVYNGGSCVARSGEPQPKCYSETEFLDNKACMTPPEKNQNSIRVLAYDCPSANDSSRAFYQYEWTAFNDNCRESNSDGRSRYDEENGFAFTRHKTPTGEICVRLSCDGIPNDVPDPVCVDAEWIEARGLEKVHVSDGVGKLLCISALGDLPCGTPDHVLEMASGSLRTYAEVCAERECTSKVGRFNGVLHSDAHMMPSQDGLRVTTVSHRGTWWSGVENRLVVSLQKLRIRHIDSALAYMQRKNSVSYLSRER